MSQEGLFRELQQLKYSVTRCHKVSGLSCRSGDGSRGRETLSSVNAGLCKAHHARQSVSLGDRPCFFFFPLATTTRCALSPNSSRHTPSDIISTPLVIGYNTLSAFGQVSRGSSLRNELTPLFFPPAALNLGGRRLFSALTKILWSNRCRYATDFTCCATPRDSSLCITLVEFPFETISNFPFPPN